MSAIRLTGSTSGYAEITPSAIAGDQTFTLPGTGGTLITATGGQTVEFADGSAGSPSIANSGDNNTGIFFPAADTIGFAEGGSEAARIDSGGRLLVGTSTSASSIGRIQAYVASGSIANRLDSGSVGTNDQIYFNAEGSGRGGSFGIIRRTTSNACGYIYLQEEDGGNAYYWTDNSGNFRVSSSIDHAGTTSGTVVGTQTSDERLKNILGPVEYGLETLKQIEPVRYALKSEPDTEKLGFIAQQVLPLVPQSVFDTGEEIEEGEPTKLGMEYVALIPVLVNAIKELSDKNDALEARLAILEAAQ